MTDFWKEVVYDKIVKRAEMRTTNENRSHWFGNIAQKAYLPTYSECRHLAEFVLQLETQKHDKKSLISMALQKLLGP